MNPIPFNKPFIAGRELQYIAEAVENGNISGDGAFTQRCAELMESKFGITKVLLTPSCTAALEMASMLADLSPGDEAIVPSFTFVSTASAIARCGATPVFVDIEPETLNLDPQRFREAITDHTKVVFPIHYGGVAADMTEIIRISRDNNLLVVEDAAQGVNAKYQSQYLGAIGDMGVYSFHETKNFICGEGGAICLNRPDLVERAEIIRDKGTNRKQFFRGLVDKYTWVDHGSSYVPSEINCAFLFGQLECMDLISEKRRQLYETYQNGLQQLASAELLKLPVIPEHCESNHHTFFVITSDGDTRDRLLEHLRDREIHAVFHYVPLHSSPMGLAVGKSQDLPVTEDLSRRLIRLPMYFELTDGEQQRVIDAVYAFYGVTRA